MYSGGDCARLQRHTAVLHPGSLATMCLLSARHCAAWLACAQPPCTRAQDFLTSAFLVTSRDCFYTRAEAAALAAFMGDACDAVDLPPPALHKPLELWTGKQMFALLVRPSARSRCGPCPCSATSASECQCWRSVCHPDLARNQVDQTVCEQAARCTRICATDVIFSCTSSVFAERAGLLMASRPRCGQSSSRHPCSLAKPCAGRLCACHQAFVRAPQDVCQHGAGRAGVHQGPRADVPARRLRRVPQQRAAVRAPGQAGAGRRQ